jgi:hypothetical protein
MIGVTARSAASASLSSLALSPSALLSRIDAAAPSSPPQFSLQLYTPTLSIATRVPSSSICNHSSSSLSRSRLLQPLAQKGKPHLLPSPASAPPPSRPEPRLPERGGVEAVGRSGELEWCAISVVHLLSSRNSLKLACLGLGYPISPSPASTLCAARA